MTAWARVAVGVLRLARGRADGLAAFEDTPQAVLSALAPLAGVMLVAFVATLLADMTPALHAALLATLLASAVGLLAQLVFSFELARRWGRAAAWYRFAAAFCWCHFAAPLAMLALIVAMSLMLASGVPEDAAKAAGLVGLVSYGLWLHWFLARQALDLTRLRAVALVVLVDGATLVLINLPDLASVAG